MNGRTGAWLGTLLMLLLAGSAQAALLERLGGQAYYDTDLDVSWLADANLAESNTFGVMGINAGGWMTWDKANEWIAAMNASNSGNGYLGYSDWRLPTTLYPDPSCGSGGFNNSYNCSGSEMGHLFYRELGGRAAQLLATTHNDNYDLFSNIQSNHYWSESCTPSLAWAFSFLGGSQNPNGNFKSNSYPVWAVRSGDSALEAPVVPLPGTVWLLGSALGVLGAVRRRAW